MRNSDIKFSILLGLSVTIFLIVLFFGLRTKGFDSLNGATWLEDEPGIRFGNYGIAYGLIDNDQVKQGISGLNAFSIEIAVRPESFYQKGFNLILCLHDGKDNNQLIVGQYESYIIAMNGDDYSHRRKTKRIYADILSKKPEKVLLTVTTGHEGTRLYADGRLIEARSDLVLKIPQGDRLKLTLGNSVYGKGSWKGDLYGLALYGDELEQETITNHFKAWSENQVLSFSGNDKPLLAFTFNEGKGAEITDTVAGIQKLSIPSRFTIPERQYISLPWRDFKADKRYLMDFIINLAGFIPLGFVICALFIQSGGIFQKKAVLFSVIFCFLTSLCIEIAQAWIPSRSSQGLDLVLNTIGAWIGAMLTRWEDGRRGR